MLGVAIATCHALLQRAMRFCNMQCAVATCNEPSQQVTWLQAHRFGDVARCTDMCARTRVLARARGQCERSLICPPAHSLAAHAHIIIAHETTMAKKHARTHARTHHATRMRQFWRCDQGDGDGRARKRGAPWSRPRPPAQWLPCVAKAARCVAKLVAAATRQNRLRHVHRVAALLCGILQRPVLWCMR
jgi:hypothetical protein